MNNLESGRKTFEVALVGLLNSWRVWNGDDEVRAVHIGFDSANIEISVSLLTDREPYLEEARIEPFGKRWPTADWRLTNINETYRHSFPDAKDLLELMALKAVELSTEELFSFNQELKTTLFEVVVGPKVKETLAKFRRLASPIKIRVEWFFDGQPLDADLQLP